MQHGSGDAALPLRWYTFEPMPLVTTDAFVLRTYSLAEADKICVFFTRHAGKVRGVAHGARKLKSRFGSALEPMTEVRLKYFQKENRELIHISSCDIVRSHFRRAARDVETANAFSYLAELLAEIVQDQEPNERLYRLVGASLDAIEEARELSKVLRYFEAWVLRLGGYFPDVSRCAGCDEAIDDAHSTFITAEGSPRCSGCSGGRGMQIDSAVRNVIDSIFCLHPKAFVAQTAPALAVSTIGDINYQIIRHALERDLKSRALLTNSLPEPARIRR
jgi:DNA repair protein RecO (recombination protein O)